VSAVDTELKCAGGMRAMLQGRVAPVIRGEVTAKISGRMDAGFCEGPTDFFPATGACKVF